MGDLSHLFAPDGVAVVGATDREGSVGRAVLENLLADFAGRVVPVNPNYEAVLGHDCVDSIGEAGVDLAVVVVPPDAVIQVVREAGEAGVGAVVVITAGFGETGSEGASRERRLREVADEYDLDLVGPNCLGVMSTGTGLNATFAPANAHPGRISLMSQSGAFVTAVLDWANDRGIGFRDVVSLGNEAVLDETDFVAHWGEDPETDVVIGYVEGIEDGRNFVDVAREVTRETPVVVVKAGRTQAGAKAASSHTGSIAGSDQAYQAGLEQAGVIRVETVQDLFDVAVALAGQPLPSTEGVAIVTNAGGPGVMATDAIGDSTLSLASLGEETIATLQEVLPPSANVYNPVDALGDADVDRFRAALDAVLADDAVGAAVVMSAPTATIDYGDLAEAVADLQGSHGVPVMACLMGGRRVEEAAETLEAAGIPNYFDPSRGVRSLDALRRYREIRERDYGEPATFDVDRAAAREVLERAAARDDPRLGVEATPLLDAYGIPRPDGEVVDSPVDAVEAAEPIEGPVAMKIVSPDILHKTDIGGVRLGVENEDVYDAYEDLVTRARNYQPDATILGVQVQEQLDLDEGVETIAGVNRDPQFGPLVMFGLGGIFVEVLEDATFRVAPISQREAEAMTEEIEAAPLLRGARGRPPVDTDGLVDTLARLSQLATDFPAILELDINPLVATPTGVCAVDLRLTIDPEKL